MMKHLMIVLFSSLLVAACGGNGGGGGGGDGGQCPTCQACQECSAPQECTVPPPGAGCELDGIKVPITKTNSVKAAIDPLNTAGAALLSATFSVRVFDYFRSPPSPLPENLTAAAVAPEGTCPGGGTFTREVNDPDANNMPSSGDSYNFTFTNCSFNNNVLNGSFKVNLVQVMEDDPISPPFTHRYDYDHFSIQHGSSDNAPGAAPKNGTLQSPYSQNWQIILTGDMTADVSPNQGEVIKLSGTSLNIVTFIDAPFLGQPVLEQPVQKSINRTLSGYAFQWNFTGDETTISLKGTLDSDYIGGSVDFETPASSPIKWSYSSENNYPSTGQMNVTGLCNSKVTLNILNDTNVQLQVDTKGNGVSQTVDTTWDDLQTNAITVFFYFFLGIRA